MIKLKWRIRRGGGKIYLQANRFGFKAEILKGEGGYQLKMYRNGSVSVPYSVLDSFPSTEEAKEKALTAYRLLY